MLSNPHRLPHLRRLQELLSSHQILCLDKARQKHQQTELSPYIQVACLGHKQQNAIQSFLLTPKRTASQRNQRAFSVITPVQRLPIPEFLVRKKASLFAPKALSRIELTNVAGVEVSGACRLAGFVSVARDWQHALFV